MRARKVRMITRIRRSAYAISPVIAILLMIAITVVASLVAYAWISGYMGGTMTKMGNAIEIPSYASGSDGNLLVYVQNVGQGSVTIRPKGSVYINDVLKEVNTLEQFITITPGQTIPLSIKNCLVTSGAALEIKVVTSEGISTQVSGSVKGGVHQGLYSVIVSILPSAAGTVTGYSTGPVYHIGDIVTLTVSPQNGYTFYNWGGDGSGTSTSCQITVTKDMSVAATFTKNSIFYENFEVDGCLDHDFEFISLPQDSELYVQDFYAPGGAKALNITTKNQFNPFVGKEPTVALSSFYCQVAIIATTLPTQQDEWFNTLWTRNNMLGPQSGGGPLLVYNSPTTAHWALRFFDDNGISHFKEDTTLDIHVGDLSVIKLQRISDTTNGGYRMYINGTLKCELMGYPTNSAMTTADRFFLECYTSIKDQMATNTRETLIIDDFAISESDISYFPYMGASYPVPPPPGPVHFFIDGFESGDFSKWTGAFSELPSPTPSVATNPVYKGSYAAQIQMNAGFHPAYEYKIINELSGCGEIHLRFYFQLQSLIINDGDQINVANIGESSSRGVTLRIYGDGSTPKWEIWGRDVHAEYWNPAKASTGPAYSVWYCVELVLVTGIHGNASLYIDGVKVAQSGEFNAVAYGNYVGVGGYVYPGNTVSCSFDDLDVADTYIGP
jgi:uncharacterized repeat protein (TIGR02543 family)